MKKKNLIVLTCFSALALVAGAFVVNNTNMNIMLRTGAEERTITLDSENAPTITNALGTLELDEFQTINYVGVREVEGEHVLLDALGTIEKYESTYNLVSVTAVFDGSLLFECDYQESFINDHLSAYLVSGESLDIVGNHWKITAETDTVISSISITYGCLSEAVDPGTSTKVTGIQEVDKFGELIKRDGVIYFAVRANYDLSYGRVVASNLTLRGDSASQAFPCSYVNITSKTEFTAYFDVSSSHATILGDNPTATVHAHLLVSGVGWNGGSGNIGLAKAKFTTQRLYERSLTVDGDKCITMKRYITGGGVVMPMLVFENRTIFEFNTNFAKDPSRAINDANPFGAPNGGSSTGGYNKEFGIYRYGNNAKSTYTTTIVASKATTAKYYLVTGGRAGTTFAGDVSEGTTTYLNTMTLDGSTTGVTLSHTIFTFENNPVNSYDTWHRFNKVEMATLSLKEGTNLVSFQFATTNSNNNVNISGIAVEPSDSDAKINLYRKFDTNYSNSPATENNEWNPFSATNHGSVCGECSFDPEASNVKNYTAEYGRYRYGEFKDYLFTTNIIMEDDADVVFKIIADSRAGRKMSYEEVVEDVTMNNYISMLTVNGSTTPVTPSSVVTDFIGWGSPVDIEIATLSLSKGSNEITFRFSGTDKINVSGIVCQTGEECRLGGRLNHYRFDINHARIFPSWGNSSSTEANHDPNENECNPFSSAYGGSVAGSGWNYKYETGQLFRYGECHNHEMTTVLTVSRDVTVRFYLIASSGPGGRTFRYTETVGGKTATLFMSSFTVNGSSEGVTPSDKLTTFTAWENYYNVEVADLDLIAGSNVIKFTYTGNQGNPSKMNIHGIAIDSEIPVRLGY